MTQSPLLAVHPPAATVTLAGWTVAEHYGEPAAEVAAVHRDAGLIDRSVRGRLAVTGADRREWLNRIVSQDTATLAPGAWRRALLLTVKGRIAADLRVFATADRLLLDTAFDAGEGLVRNLQSFVLYGDGVTVEDVASMGKPRSARTAARRR